MVSTTTKRHLIYPFWIYSIGLYEAFRKFFISYYNSHKLVKLNESEDSLLLNELRMTINLAFAVTSNELEPKFINKFFNACHRVFGRPPPGPDQAAFNDYPKPEVFTEGFFTDFENCLVEFAVSIQEVGTTEIKLGNYSTIADYLNNIRQTLVNNTFNEVEELTRRAIEKFTLLLNLVRNDDLMVKRLGLRASDENARIIEFCKWLQTPVAANPKQLIDLAGQMEIFLILVESTEWTPDLVKPFVEDPSDRQTMVELIKNYSRSTNKDIFELATSKRNKATK